MQSAPRTRWTVSRWNTHYPLAMALIMLGVALAWPGSALAFVSSGSGSWHSQDASSAGDNSTLTSVDFVDVTHGWAVGGNGAGAVILVTADGGTTWRAQDASRAGSGAWLCSVNFVNRSDGWAVGSNFSGGVILVTKDGGATWRAQTDPSNSSDLAQLQSVRFVNSTDGWAVGEDYDGSGSPVAVIIATADGGATWTVQDALTDTYLESVAFVSAKTGWAVGHSFVVGTDIQPPLILATSDGGETWEAQDASAEGTFAHLYSVSFVDPSHGWVVGDEGIMATENGGATWDSQDGSAAGSDAIFGSVSFADAKHGWAADIDGIILATSDGGATWHKQRTNDTEGLSGLDFVDAAHGWVVGSTFNGATNTGAPLILATTTGGVDVNQDSDGDGLPDEWETKGVDTDGDGAIEVDLPAMGADPNRKDIFVEIDWMVDPRAGGHSHKPKAEALKLVTDAFKAQGIALHIDAGPGSVMDPYHPDTKWGEYSTAGNASAAGPVLEVKDLVLSKDWARIWNLNFQRAGVFHYCLFAHGYNGGVSTGIAERPGGWLLVADGMLNHGDSLVTEQAGTFMHELGHNLGMQHGGGDIVTYKPNYLSVMNYSFQTSGLLGGDGEFGAIDYSHKKLNTLDEGSLNEGDGIGPASDAGNLGTVYWRDGRGGDLISTKAPIRVNAPFGRINWNGLWSDSETGIQEDLNTGKDESEVVLGQKLTGYDDWANLHFTGGGGIGPSALAVNSDSPRQARASTAEWVVEPPYQQFVASGLVLRDYRVAVTAEPGNVIFAQPDAGALALSLKVTNEGLEPDTYSIQTWGLDGASLGSVPSSMHLLAGASETVSVPVALPAGTPDGLVGSVRLLATSNGSPRISDEVDVAVYIKAPPSTVILKLSGLNSGALRLGRSVAVKGVVTPTSLVGSTVKLSVQRKRNGRWVPFKSVSRTISASATYGWTYKPSKRGAYRVRTTIAKTVTHTAAKTTWRAFKVK